MTGVITCQRRPLKWSKNASFDLQAGHVGCLKKAPTTGENLRGKGFK